MVGMRIISGSALPRPGTESGPGSGSGSALASHDAPAAAMSASKSATQENFPVGSWLLAPAKRAPVALYHAFARAADDIADDPDRGPEQKLAELDAMDAVLLHGRAANNPDTDKAARLRPVLDRLGIPAAHASELLIAFRRDATKRRYRDWAELIDYCRYSAAPVGRFLLDLHGESRATWPAADALCSSLQVINHLQDCKPDYLRLDRVYLPEELFAAAGAGIPDLAGDRAGPGLRQVLDRCLDAVERLNREARALPRLIRGRRMRLEAAVIVEIAHRLAALLRRSDPIAARVVLSAGGRLGSLLGGLRRAW